MRTWIAVLIGIGIAAAVAVAASYTCAIDSGSMTWTGKTKTEEGQILKQYKCLKGHVAWGK